MMRWMMCWHFSLSMGLSDISHIDKNIGNIGQLKSFQITLVNRRRMKACKEKVKKVGRKEIRKEKSFIEKVCIES